MSTVMCETTVAVSFVVPALLAQNISSSRDGSRSDVESLPPTPRSVQVMVICTPWIDGSGYVVEYYGVSVSVLQGPFLTVIVLPRFV